MKKSVKIVAALCGVFLAVICVTQNSNAIISQGNASKGMQIKQITSTQLDTLGKCSGNDGICFTRGGATYIGEWIEFVH